MPELTPLRKFRLILLSAQDRWTRFLPDEENFVCKGLVNDNDGIPFEPTLSYEPDGFDGLLLHLAIADQVRNASRDFFLRLNRVNAALPRSKAILCEEHGIVIITRYGQCPSTEAQIAMATAGLFEGFQKLLDCDYLRTALKDADARLRPFPSGDYMVA